MPNCLVVQHVAPESAWALNDALVRAGVGVDTRRVFAEDPLPGDLSSYDGLVVMGGPMSAASDHEFPTRRHELSLLQTALAQGVPTVGVCLGAQLVAHAAGAAVYPGGPGAEIGWSPVTLTAAGRTDSLFADVPERLNVLQWHGDTFDLPDDAVLLASNAAYPNQAFRIGAAAWGLQFHLEVTAQAVDGFLDAFAEDARRAPGGADAIRSATPAALSALRASRDLIFSRFGALVAAGGHRVEPAESLRRFANISDS
jgi:GMP synthase-like glutamine amidotransferase